MVEAICDWLPDLELYDSKLGWKQYEDRIYNIFSEDFKISYPTFEGKRVKIRYSPIELNKEEGFYHVTCQDYNKDGDRFPDIRRCERIRWVRKFIENYNCGETCTLCSGIKIWEEPYKNNLRTHILLEEEKYMVVIEKRTNYYMLITAFYFDQEHTLKKKLKKYEQYKAKSAS